MYKYLIDTALLSVLLFAGQTGLRAQEPAARDSVEEGFRFTTVKELPITPVKNQFKSSTCWCFSSMGFFESELLRMGKGEYDFSEMFVVHKTMEDRAQASVRLHGDISFSPGGSFYDAVYCFRHYGLVPQEVMPGILYGDTLPNHNELDAVAGGYVSALIGARGNKSSVWRNGLSAIYDAYLGECPDTFVYQGKEYTPKSYAASLGLDMDDYVSLTSFTHHPLHEQFVIEIQDNWRWALSYNLTLDELMEVIRHAVQTGYTVLWGADVSEPGFTRKGLGVVIDPQQTPKDLKGSDMDHWLKMSEAEKSTELLSKPSEEMAITPELRQEGFDNWKTTDDHGMLIYGIANDQNGKPYYMVKNSWGLSGEYKGLWYVSEAFVAYKTINILVHKDAIPKEIRKAAGIR